MKKINDSVLLGAAGLLTGLAGMLIKNEQAKKDKNEAIEKAAEKAAKMVMDKLSSKN